MHILLSASSRFTEIKDGVIAFFNNFGVLSCAAIILAYALIYFVAKVLRENEATKLMILYWFLLLVGVGMRVFVPDIMTLTVCFVYVVLLSFTMLLLFGMEVKKYFWDVHKTKESGGTFEKIHGGNAEIRSREDTERSISNIVKALQNMSKNNVGALIVLSKGSLPKQVLQSGVMIDAEISTQLIEGIFFPKAPLHDGAMVIQGHKIQAAGCFLPLTQKTSYPKEYGTRHRAGIGITEVANVVSLIVSEETGIISIVKQGVVTRYADYDMLMDALKDYYWQEMPLTDRKRGANK